MATQPFRSRTRRSALGLIVTAATVGAGCSGEEPRATARPAAQVAAEAAVDVRANGCKTVAFRGGGSVVTGGFVLTAAHVVSGAETITVAAPAGTVAATLLAIDPVHDLAILGAAAPDRTPLELAHAPLAAGAPATVVVFRDGAAQLQEVRIHAPVIVRILDIFHEAEVDRPGYRVDADIEAGDSGAVLVDDDGHAAGVFYARSRHTDGRAFASDTTAMPALLASAATVDPEVGIDTGDCV